ncbi:hypothetical protein KC347_g307 [Hortaea werneckii]|nr:hypothetical protein KC347_g307 [Hortaea werneckii]
MATLIRKSEAAVQAHEDPDTAICKSLEQLVLGISVKLEKLVFLQTALNLDDLIVLFIGDLLTRSDNILRSGYDIGLCLD